MLLGSDDGSFGGVLGAGFGAVARPAGDLIVMPGPAL